MFKNKKDLKAIEKKRRLELALRKNLKRRKMFSNKISSKTPNKSLSVNRENN